MLRALLIVLLLPLAARTEAAAASDTATLLAELVARAPDENVAIRESDAPDAPITALYGDLFDGQPGAGDATARAFLEKFGALLAFPPGKDLPPELDVKTEPVDDHGQVVKLTPTHGKVPYHSGTVQLRVAASGKLVSVVGRHRKLENVQAGSLKAPDAVKRGLSELAKLYPGSWLASDGTLREYLEDAPDGTIRHVYEMGLPVGADKKPRRIVLGPGGEVLEEDFGAHRREARGGVYLGYPTPAPAEVPLVDLLDVPDVFGGKPAILWGNHFQPVGDAPFRAMSASGEFVFPEEKALTVPHTKRKTFPNPQFLETHVYHHLTIAREKALKWGAKEVDTKTIAYDVWLLPKHEEDYANMDQAFFEPADFSMRFAVINRKYGNRHPATDISVIYHEYGHFVRHVVNPNAHSGGTVWQRWNALAVNEGFSDFLSSQITGKNHEGYAWRGEVFGRSTVETLKYCDVAPPWENSDAVKKLKKPPPGARKEIHEAGQCFSALCNDLKQEVGDDIMPMLIRATRTSKNPATFENMAHALLADERQRNGGKRFDKMQELMVRRGVLKNKCPDPKTK